LGLAAGRARRSLARMKYAPFFDIGQTARGQRPPRVGEAVPLPVPDLSSLLARIKRRWRG